MPSTNAQVKLGLANVAQTLEDARSKARRAVKLAKDARSMATDLAVIHADVKDTIDAYTPSGAFETLAKDELTRFISDRAEFLSAIDELATAADNTDLDSLGS